MSSLLSSVLGNVTYYLPSWRTQPAPPSNREVLDRRFGPDGAEVINKYFSSYAEGLLPLDDSVFQKIDQVLQRRAQGRQIAREWTRIIFSNKSSLDCSHREIPNEPLLITALTAQFTFDRELLKLKKLDRYQRLSYGKVQPELNLLQRAIAPKKHWWSCPERFSEKENQFLDQLREKAQTFGRSFHEQVGHSIQSRRDLQEQLQKRIQVIKNAKLPEHEEPLLNPRSLAIRQLLEESQNQQRSPVNDDLAFHQSLNDHYVYACGDPIMDSKAKFIIVKRPEGIPDNVWERVTSSNDIPEKIKAGNMFQTKKPNESVFIEVAFDDLPGEKWAVEVCYENVADTLQLHENRDLKMNTRRLVQGPGKYERANIDKEEGLIASAKEMWRKSMQYNWSPHREATAGPDFHEATTINLGLIWHMLHGRMDQFPQKECQNLGEYFDSLPKSDVANLKGSYGSHPRFIQAQRIHQFIHENLKKNHFEAGAIIPYLEKGADAAYSWEKDRARPALLTQDIFESYSAWSRNLSNFLFEMQKPENRNIASAIGKETLDQLGPFIQSLNEFIANTPHQALKEVLARKMEINDRFERIQQDLIRERDELAKVHKNDLNRLNQEVERIEEQRRNQNIAKAEEINRIWPQWRSNKTPEEIDQILSSTLFSIQEGLKRFTQSLVQINVPFSSAYRQNQIEELMKKRSNMIDLYWKTIPPIWQNKVKLQTLVQGELMKGTELSPHWLVEADTMEVADQELVKNEFIRSRFAKEQLA